MGKKTANKAIDFARLFAVKEQVARQAEASEVVLEAVPPAPVDDDVEGTEEAKVPDADEARGEEPVAGQEMEPATATVLTFPTAIDSVSPSVVASESRSDDQSSTKPRKRVQAAPAKQDVLLRIGMTRQLHDRLRASAALEGKPATVYVRDVLEASVPEFKANTSLAQLARVARELAPVGASGPRRIEMRMQVPATDGLHRRLVQVAALRAQTLAASLIDLLDAHVPSM